MTIKERLDLIIKACEDKKAIDLEVINIETSGFCDYFVIASGNSNTQVKAIADGIIKDLSEYEQLKDINPLKEGYTEGKWVLLDYGDIIVHIFHKNQREFYNLERLWEEE